MRFDNDNKVKKDMTQTDDRFDLESNDLVLLTMIVGTIISLFAFKIFYFL